MKQPYIDLTRSLPSLRSSLTPDTKRFEDPSPLYICRRQPEDVLQWPTRLFLVVLLTTIGILLADYIASHQ